MGDNESEGSIDEWRQLAQAEADPSRRVPLLHELAKRLRASGLMTEAVAALAEAARFEANARARAVLHYERGDLLLRELHQSDQARECFQLALADDATQLGAVRALVELLANGPPEKFTAIVERLRSLAGPAAIVEYREPLAHAYESMGRLKDALKLLSELEASPDRLRRRIRLASAVGLHGEALVLREKVAGSAQELDAVLKGFLDAELVPFAVRLGTRLYDEGTLTPSTMRLAAERLAPTTQGAPLASRIWPRLLRENPTDADGWTLYAEALRFQRRESAAQLADGFGAALTSSTGAASRASLRAVRAGPGSAPDLPKNLGVVTAQSMPYLHACTREMLRALGAGALSVAIDVEGGAEAFVAQNQLVIGANALGVFSEAELPFLLALAVALGESGQQLRLPGEVAAMADAARAALEAYPSSLAGCRVLARLDAAVRGAGPRAVDVGKTIRSSQAFHAMAQTALDILST
jgi:tetratricopeptide (TPR) repeat protein